MDAVPGRSTQSLGSILGLDRAFDDEAKRLLDSRLDDLRGLSYAEAVALPEATGNDIDICGARTAVTIFRQAMPTEPGAVLVTVQVARRRILATYGPVFERGLVFSPAAAAREATDAEL
jgi:hypothetical protein